MAGWSLLSNHGRVLVCIARNPGIRLRDIAASLGITERSAYSIVTALTEAGYVVKHKDGRRNRYQVQARLPCQNQAAADPRSETSWRCWQAPRPAGLVSALCGGR
jgi:DNA-binding MarR family transcriptional regulator